MQKAHRLKPGPRTPVWVLTDPDCAKSKLGHDWTKTETGRVKKTKPKARKKCAPTNQSAIVSAKAETVPMPLPRARTRLRSAMRKVGLDEWKIAWLLNYKIDCFAELKTSSGNKLLLDYLKEAARHLDPASPRATAEQEAPTIEIVHDVPRPNRSEPDEPQI